MYYYYYYSSNYLKSFVLKEAKMSMNRVRAFFRLVMRTLKRILSEFTHCRSSVAQIIKHLIDKGILFIELKYHCLEIRRRMSDVRSHNEW